MIVGVLQLLCFVLGFFYAAAGIYDLKVRGIPLARDERFVTVMRDLATIMSWPFRMFRDLFGGRS